MRKLVIPKYYGRPSIGLPLSGCASRPFYHVCVFSDKAVGAPDAVESSRWEHSTHCRIQKARNWYLLILVDSSIGLENAATYFRTCFRTSRSFCVVSDPCKNLRSSKQHSLSLTVTDALLHSYCIDPSFTSFLAVGTEMLIDKSESVKTEPMRLFGDNLDVEGVDVKNACFGGTQAVFHAADWIYASYGAERRDAIAVLADIDGLRGKGDTKQHNPVESFFNADSVTKRQGKFSKSTELPKTTKPPDSKAASSVNKSVKPIIITAQSLFDDNDDSDLSIFCKK